MLANFRSHNRLLIAILFIALVLRLGYALAQDHDAPYTKRGGDTVWYLQNGYTLVTGDDPTGRHLMERLPTAPLYLIFIGASQAIFSPDATAIIVIRIVQALLSTATVYFAYRIARQISGKEGIGLLTAAILAISPVLILETAQILTETLYVFWIMAGLMVYMDAVDSSLLAMHGEGPGVRFLFRWLALTGILFGLATLTRAVLLLFPLGLAIHLVLARGWRTGLKHAAILLVAYSLVVSTWTVYNLARWNRLVIGAEGMASFIYVGSRGWDAPQEVDQNLSEDLGVEDDDTEAIKNPDDYLTAAQNVIADDPTGYIAHRVKELADAYLQPHGTVILGGESLKNLARDWSKDDRSPGGLIDLMRSEHFWPKLALYVFHFGGLLLAVAGMWLTRAQWRFTLPLIGFIAYTTLLHLVMLALPRYIFPIYPVVWILAAVALGMMWQRIQQRPVAT
ncbi:MAG: phospholipid carrier-dependent glycosyltransferase [Anaerolineae bacterium]|nr:phospholipid carrier-dependent glycosyltransferase [Anaerolineae bacterium]